MFPFLMLPVPPALWQRTNSAAGSEEALQRDPAIQTAHFRLAQLYRAIGNLEKSREHLRLCQKR